MAAAALERLVKMGHLVAAAQHLQPYHWYGTLAAWGNIGSLIAGVSAVLLAGVAIVTGTAGLRDWREKQRAEKALADEERVNIQLDRRRVLNGWSPHGLPVYGVALVTESGEMERAQKELTGGGPTSYVILRVSEDGDDVNRARQLRELVEKGFITGPPGRGEYEALEAGRKVLLGDRAGYGAF